MKTRPNVRRTTLRYLPYLRNDGTYIVSLSAENGVSSVVAAPITVQVEDAEPPTYTLWLPLVRR